MNYTESYDFDDLPGIDLSDAPDSCLSCNEYVKDSVLYQRLRVCHKCRFHHAISALRYIAIVADQGSFKESDVGVRLDEEDGEDDSYSSRLEQERERTGLNEAVVTGTCRINGIETVLISLNYSFHGGKLGVVVGEKVTLALERAARKGMPCVAIATSSGVRGEEGIISMFQTAKMVGAISKLTKKRTPFIVVMGNPCTGQVFSSFASQADVLLAEPNSRVGFVAPLDLAVPTPNDTYRSESLADWGTIDGVADREQLASHLGGILETLTNSSDPVAASGDSTPNVSVPANVEKLAPGDWVAKAVSDPIVLNRRFYAPEPRAILGGIGKVKGRAVVFIHTATVSPGESDKIVTPEDLLAAVRLAKLAERFKIPLLLFLGLARPATGLKYEQRGIGGAISQTIAAMISVEVPTIAVLVGEVGGDVTVSLSIADRVIMDGETASWVVLADRAADREQTAGAESVRITPDECLKLGIVDAVAGASDSDEGTHYEADPLLAEVTDSLNELISKRLWNHTKRRLKHFRSIDKHMTTSPSRPQEILGSWQVGLVAAAKSLREQLGSGKQD